jgi:cytochrome c biogenesis protein CcdA
MPEAFHKFSLPIVSIMLGTAAFFSPCAFTVLPAYVTHYLTQEKTPQRQTLSKGLYFGVLAALGVISVNVSLGLTIALLGSATPFAKDPREDIPLILGIRTLAGFLIAYLGLATILGKSFEIPILQKFADRASSKEKSIFFYGVLYNVAAIGCTGPILLGLILYTLTLSSFVASLTSFIIFSLTMGILMVGFTLALTLTKENLARKLAPVTPTIHKIAGTVMIITCLTIALLTLEGNKVFVKIFFPFLK